MIEEETEDFHFKKWWHKAAVCLLSCSYYIKDFTSELVDSECNEFV